MKKEEKKKKERERKKKELFTKNPTFTITSPEQRNINLEIESSIDIALIDYQNWPQKSQLISRLNAGNTRLLSRIHPSLTDELSSPMINDMQIFPKKKITELSGIVIIQ